MYTTSLQSLLLFLLPLCTCSGVASQVIDEQQLLDLPFSRNCTRSLTSENDQTHGEVVILPYDPATNNAAPKIPELNASAWELYFFDAVSPSSSAITLSYFREGIHLKVQLLAMWPNGETFVTEFLAKQSEIEECAASGVKGSWRGEHGGSATFEITQDLSTATIDLDISAAAQGSITFSSLTAPWTPDVDVNEKNDAFRLLAPTVYWLQPMARASVQVDLNIEGKELAFTGLGGHDRFWSPHSWMTLMDESVYLRAHAGPYTLIMLRIMSRVDRGRPRASVHLFKEDERIFATQKERISLSTEYYSFKRTYHGNVAGRFLDSSTGFTVDLVSPVDGRHWRFEIEHESVWWNMPTGPTGTGNSGFVDKVVGGEVGGEIFEGTGSAGVCQLPKLPKMG